MSSGLTRGNHRPVKPHAQVSADGSAAVSGSELWRSAPAKASTPVEARALTYEERRDRWRREAGTLRWSASDAPDDRLQPAETWLGLHP